MILIPSPGSVADDMRLRETLEAAGVTIECEAEDTPEQAADKAWEEARELVATSGAVALLNRLQILAREVMNSDGDNLTKEQLSELDDLGREAESVVNKLENI